MNPAHIDDFYYVSAEVLCSLYAAFPVRNLLLVEDLTGPIRWDLTGLPDRKSRACFETIIWLSEHDLFTFRSIEPREVGVEGAVLSQKAFVLLTGRVSWEDGQMSSRIEALKDARARRAYDDIGNLIQDLLHANCHWSAARASEPLPKPASVQVEDIDEAGLFRRG
ncbi:MAG: hypothetical protein V2I82_17345 [Halieaceae bacterium]|nr:hypothetical protein [Halieaceae bacterium]